MIQTNNKQTFTARTSLNLSPFSKRTSALNQSQEWRRWGGYLSATQYELHHENEYFAIRTKAALLDISPLYKYSIKGSDAKKFLNLLVTRNIQACNIHQVMYTPWCDEHGKVIDDGTVQYLEENNFRLTSAEPNLSWLIENSKGMNVSIKDESQSTAALALQGPNSRKILNILSTKPLDNLKFFWLTHTKLNEIPVTISRTGYTGDLGYEIWLNPSDALTLWDTLMEAGESYGITPAGLQALDIARIEAGLILLDVDYISSRNALIDSRKSSPFELGLGWTVKTKKNSFLGKNALLKEKSSKGIWKFCGIEIQWNALEKKYKEIGLSPSLPSTAWRNSTPLFKNDRQIGYATSGCWSPLLKRYIALAHIEAQFAKIGSDIEFDLTVEHYHHRTPATIIETPFYNPERKRSCPK